MSDDKDKQVLHTDSAETTLPEYDQGILSSPCCSALVVDGFGLAGGGFGVYNYCNHCGRILTKSITDD